MTKKTIKINPNTHERLLERGKKGETFNGIINRLLDKTEDEGREK